MLRLKLYDYLADFHTWVSVYSCPSPSSFTHTQRLSVCLLLLLGYACVGAVIVAQTDDQVGWKKPSKLKIWWARALKCLTYSSMMRLLILCLQLLFVLGFVDVSAGAVTNGLVSVVAVLPVATAVSFLFRLRAVQPTGSRVQRAKGRKTEKEYSEGKLVFCGPLFAFCCVLSWNVHYFFILSSPHRRPLTKWQHVWPPPLLERPPAVGWIQDAEIPGYTSE